MLESVDDLLTVATSVFGGNKPPHEFRVLAAVRELPRSEAPGTLAEKANTTLARLRAIAASADPIQAVFKTTLLNAAEKVAGTKPFVKARRSLGQMLLGELAEREFERVYRRTLGTDELLQLTDARSARTETDYHVINGDGKPVFRLNIKFHGTLFENARTMVALEPDDCFALATYKIYQGIQKQVAERRPYVFVIVSVPRLTADVAGAAVPDDLVHLSALVFKSNMSGKRDVEDAIVGHLIDHEQAPAVRAHIVDFAQRIEQAHWRVISARRADRLLHDLLFDRVFAVRQRSFAQTQVNMHFSLSRDLTPFAEFARLRADRGLHGLAVMLEAGDL